LAEEPGAVRDGRVQADIHWIIMEKENLINRWRALDAETPEPADSSLGRTRGVLEERLEILHRLNELGVYRVDSHSIIEALEQANFGLRQIDKQEARRN
jgi:hypothetical protein